jgi:hypothetical protein
MLDVPVQQDAKSFLNDPKIFAVLGSELAVGVQASPDHVADSPVQNLVKEGATCCVRAHSGGDIVINTVTLCLKVRSNGCTSSAACTVPF